MTPDTLTGLSDIILSAGAATLMVPTATLAVETLSALPRGRRATVPASPETACGAAGCDTPRRPRAAVLIPAHDEEAVIAATLRSVLPQLGPQDVIVVVADNCSDRTAEIARTTGTSAAARMPITVIERNDPSRRAKGYALDFGRAALAAGVYGPTATEPPEVAVIIDADCRLRPGMLESVVRQAAATGRPAQAVYLMESPEGAGLGSRVSSLAVLFKNLVRPLGLTRMGCPVLLGTGVAMPWDVFAGLPLAHGDIVEDMRMAVDVARAGRSARLCPEAVLTALLPADRSAATGQRTRWEHGHLRTLVTEVPRLLAEAVIRRRPGLAALALEIAIPPLSLLAVAWAAMLALSGTWAAAGGSLWPLWLSSAGAGLGVAAVLAGWWRYGRETVSAADLLGVPLYVAGKVGIYLSFLLRGPQKAWVRTPRDNAASPAPSVPAAEASGAAALAAGRTGA
jgi:cellulose synthase/poly-beta-1,6-N-acetylglucosamine synthase-like glycosyltransferase